MKLLSQLDSLDNNANGTNAAFLDERRHEHGANAMMPTSAHHFASLLPNWKPQGDMHCVKESSWSRHSKQHDSLRLAQLSRNHAALEAFDLSSLPVPRMPGLAKGMVQKTKLGVISIKMHQVMSSQPQTTPSNCLPGTPQTCSNVMQVCSFSVPGDGQRVLYSLSGGWRIPSF